jgi:hypothetical protein
MASGWEPFATDPCLSVETHKFQNTGFGKHENKT